jgi:tetratricopeptide (TPR) repeat protein
MKKKIFVIPLIILVFFLVILGCAREPKKELAAAQNALEKAKEAQADRYASDIFTQAENSLKEAENLIAQKNYGEAKNLLITAKGMADTAISQALINKDDAKTDAEGAIGESQKAMEQLKETQKIALQSKLPKDKTDLSQQLPNWEDQLKKAQEEYNNGNFDVAKEIVVTAYQQISAKNNELSELIMAKQPKKETSKPTKKSKK